MLRRYYGVLYFEGTFDLLVCLLLGKIIYSEQHLNQFAIIQTCDVLGYMLQLVTPEGS